MLRAILAVKAGWADETALYVAGEGWIRAVAGKSTRAQEAVLTMENLRSWKQGGLVPNSGAHGLGTVDGEWE